MISSRRTSISAQFNSYDEAEFAARAIRNSGVQVDSIKLLAGGMSCSYYNHPTAVIPALPTTMGYSPASSTINNGVYPNSDYGAAIVPLAYESDASDSYLEPPDMRPSVVSVTCPMEFEQQVTQQLLSKGGTSIHNHN